MCFFRIFLCRCCVSQKGLLRFIFKDREDGSISETSSMSFSNADYDSKSSVSLASTLRLQAVDKQRDVQESLKASADEASSSMKPSRASASCSDDLTLGPEHAVRCIEGQSNVELKSNEGARQSHYLCTYLNINHSISPPIPHSNPHFF